MKVIVGLGNPGREYERTRHNVGWWLVDHLADAWKLGGWKRDGRSLVAAGPVHGSRVRLVKPQTYMNLSGEVLRPYLRRENFEVARDLLVAVDEVQLPVGRYRFRSKGSAGGHNGLKSVEAHVKTQEYARLRIGVGPADGTGREGALSDFVLDAMGKRESRDVEELFPELQDAVEMWVESGILATMNRFSGRGSDNDE